MDVNAPQESRAGDGIWWSRRLEPDVDLEPGSNLTISWTTTLIGA